MKRSVTWILGAVLLAATASPRSTAGDLYVLTNNTAELTAATELGTINTTTGAYSTILANVGTGAGNLAKRGNYLYFTTGIAGGAELHRFNLSTQAVELVNPIATVPFGAFTGMTYDAGGDTFYAWKQDPERNEFGTINPVTGTWTSLNNDVGPAQINPPTGGRLANHGGTYYAAIDNSDNSAGEFGTVSSGSGYVQVGASDTLFKSMNLASDSDTSTLYGIVGDGSVQQLYKFLDPSTGSLNTQDVTNIIGAGSYFHGAAFVPVPEPSTYALGMIAAVTAGWAMRRKKNRS